VESLAKQTVDCNWQRANQKSPFAKSLASVIESASMSRTIGNSTKPLDALQSEIGEHPAPDAAGLMTRYGR